MKKLVVLAVFMLASALPLFAQVQADVEIDQMPQINPLVGAPTIAITKLTLFKPDNLSQVGVEWSVQKPTLTQITRFDFAVEIRYEAGKIQDLSKSITDGSARATSFTGLPGFAVGSTKTVLATHFTTQGFIDDVETFTLGAPPSSVPRPKPLDLTQVTVATTGCGLNQDCFEVKWGASANNFPTLQSFNSFNIKLDVNYSNGTTVSGSANASGSERQKLIAVPRPHGASPQTAKATIKAVVTLRGAVQTVKQTP